MNISFIIAAYNLEAYVGACIDSIFGGAREGDEVIVVNDGSTDGTRARLADMQARHPGLRVIDKVNGGVATTRAAGLAAASGEYVLFMDGDDVLRPEALNEIRQHLDAQAPDVLVTDYLEWPDGGQRPLTPSRPRSHTPGTLQTSPADNLFETLDDCIPCLWSRIIRRAVFQRLPSPPFPLWSVHEDLATTPHIVAAARSLLYVPLPLVQYRLRADSQTTDRSQRSCMDTIRSAVHARHAIDTLPGDTRLTLMGDVFIARKWLDATRQCRETRRPDTALYRTINDAALSALTTPPAALLAHLRQTGRPEDRAAASHMRKLLAWPQAYLLLQSTLASYKASRQARRRGDVTAQLSANETATGRFLLATASPASPPVSAQPGLLVLDFSYEGCSGHHHALNQLLLESARDQQLPARILAHRNLSRELITPHTHPVFTRSAYGSCSTAKDVRRKLGRTFRSVFRELAGTGLHRASAATTILVHTAGAAHILSIAAFVKLSGLGSPVHLYLMLPPDFDAQGSAVAEQRRQYQRAFNIAARHPNIHFHCENRLLQAAYRALGCSEINLMDLPSRFPNAAREQPRPHPRTRFLFIGDPRPEKGVSLVIKALPLLSALQDQIEIELLLTSPQRCADIARDASAHDFVKLRLEPFFAEDDYFSAMRQADCVLLPYDPQAYRLKNSNMVHEALGCGTSVIVPPGDNSLTAFCQTLPLPAHVTMPSYDAEGLAQAIHAFIDRATTLKGFAQSAQDAITDRRDPARFIQHLFRQAPNA